MRRSLVLLVCAALMAAACSGEASEETADTTTTTEGTTETTDGGDDGSEDPGGDDGEFAFDTYEDDRAEPFASFQASFERNDPFSSIDEFCVSHPAAEGRADTDPGITADSIEIHHIRQQLEELEGIGFGVPIGEPAKMFEVFVDVINTQCGGIRGRTLDLGLSEFSPLSADLQGDQNATCLAATEDRNAVVVLNTTGFQGPALLCLTEEHDAVMITTQGLSDDFYTRGGGRLLTSDEGMTESVEILAQKAFDEGLLEGKTIAVVGNDSPGQEETTTALVARLTELGVAPVVVQNLGCQGSTCADGLDVVVREMVLEGVDAVFPNLNILSLPGLVSEMATQGYAPGDVQFFNSKANSQDGDLVSSKVAAFGGESAAQLYNGAYIVSSGATGNFHFIDEASGFNQMCQETYAANGGETYDYFDPAENTVAGMVSQVCSFVRLAARGLYHAGDNPTRADVAAAMADLGPYDGNYMTPNAFTDGDPTGPLAYQTMTWTYPCEIDGGAFDDNDTCIVPNADWFTPEA